VALRLKNYRFNWKLSLFVLLFLPLFLRLGFWQLAREEEKLQLQASWNARQQEPPLALQSLDPAEDLQYHQVELVGRFDNAHVFLLDNRIHEGHAGFEVIQPFATNEGLTVFVNRGWLPQGPDRRQLPLPPLLEGELRLQAAVYVPVGEPLVLGDIAPGEEWPKLIQTLDPLELAELAGLAAEARVFPYSVRLAEAAPGVLQRNWRVISTTPEKHRGYAVQWFSMATALVLLYLYYSLRPAAKDESED
jgi:surfeit locus 1 family protein